ncbi:hypothetical protein DFS33DRAFT_1279133 [Desarmillaria ectypa]|nr:hypothetical protein DFS33DRAFT_1279133 [Desarmillaria ectypa]
MPFHNIFDEPQLITYPTRVTETTRNAPNDFMTWIVFLLERNRTDSACQQPETRRYEHEHTPCHSNPADFEAWMTSLLSRKKIANTDHHGQYESPHKILHTDTVGYTGQQLETRNLQVLRHSNPLGFEAWITSLLEQKRVCTTEYHWQPAALQQAPQKDLPNDPAGFKDWLESLVQKTDKTDHRDAVRDEHPNNIFVDTPSDRPSESTTAMTGHSYPPHDLITQLHAPNPEVAARVPSWLCSAHVGAPRTGIVVD